MAYPQLRASIPSAATDVDGASVVCTHPTGLTAGDLMVLFVGTFNPGTDRTITTPTNWTLIRYVSESDRYALAAYYKIAVAGNVSAGSTTVDFSGTVDKNAYAMFAVTGAASGNEITISESDDIGPSSPVTTINVTTALTPVVAESLVLSAFGLVDFDLSAQLTASAFTITPSTTMTERVDVGVRDGASDGMSLMVASGEYAGLTQITSRSVTISESIDPGSSHSIILLVNAPYNASGTAALKSVSPTFFEETAVQVGGTGTNSLLSVEPEFFDQSGYSNERTDWNNEPRPSTGWNNETL